MYIVSRSASVGTCTASIIKAITNLYRNGSPLLADTACGQSRRRCSSEPPVLVDQLVRSVCDATDRLMATDYKRRSLLTAQETAWSWRRKPSALGRCVVGCVLPEDPKDRSARIFNKQFQKTMKPLVLFETSLTSRLTSQRHITGDTKPQQHRCENPKCHQI